MTKEKKSSNQANPINQGSDNRKQDWEIKKLGEVCVVERGSSPRPIEKYQTDSLDGVNWIKIGDTKGVDKYIFSTKEKITKEGAEKSRYVKEGDFILSNSMSFGKPYIMKTDGYIHDGWFVLRLPNYLDKDYFYYLLTSPNVQEQIQSLGAGAIVKNISGDLVKKVDITYPKSLPEQQRIVSILDQAFAAIAKAKANVEQNLQNAKELFESYLQEIFSQNHELDGLKDFTEQKSQESIKSVSSAQSDKIRDSDKGEGWEVKRFDEVCVLQRGFDLPTHSRFEGEYPLVSSNGITDNINQWKVKAPGVVTGRSGTIGNVHFIEEDFWPLNTALYIKDFHGNDERFIYYLLTAFDLSKYSSGAGVPTLNRNNVHSVKVCIPKSKSDQQIIVRQLDALRAETQKLEELYKKKIDDLEELKKSILAKAFNGELRGAEPAELKTEKSRRDDKIIGKNDNQLTNPEGMK